MEFLGLCKMFQYSTTTDIIGQFKELVKDDRVDVNATTITQYGEELSPFHLVGRYYQKDNLVEMVNNLLLHGADVNAKTNKLQMSKYYKIFSGIPPLYNYYLVEQPIKKIVFYAFHFPAFLLVKNFKSELFYSQNWTMKIRIW